MLWKCFDKNSVKLKVTLIIGPLSCRGSCKIRIVCLSFRLSVQHFPQEWHISFFDFWHDGRYLEYLKTDKALSSRKIYFHPNLSKKGQNGPNNNNNNLKWTLILLLICQYIYGKTLVVQLWAICCQPIKLQGSLKCNISREKWMINFTFGMQINVEVFYRLILSFWLCIIRHYQSTQNEFAYLCGISGKAWVMKLIFWQQISAKVFRKLKIKFLVCIAIHAQSIQNNKFTISLQYLKENIKDEFDCCLLMIVKGSFKVILSF